MPNGSNNNIRRKVGGILLLLLLFCCGSYGTGLSAAHDRQAAFNAHQVEAAFVYNLANFIYWPEESFPTMNSPFVIAVLGGTPFVEDLIKLTRNESVGRHPIKIITVDKVKDLERPHLLFIPQDKTKDLDRSLALLPATGVLTVSDSDQFVRHGGMVMLLEDHQKIRLALNLRAVERAGLRVSSKLLQLATLVTEEQP